MFISSTPIYSGLRSSSSVDSQSLNILMPLSVLCCALTFFISAVSVCCMLPRLSLLMYYNCVIHAGQNNRLFVPDTEMYRALLRLSHMQKDTFYVEICDRYRLLHGTFVFCISYPLSARGHDISSRADRLMG